MFTFFLQMDRLFKTFTSIKEFKVRRDDDYTDRLSRVATVFVLIFFAFIVSSRQWVGKPISCWCPAQFTASHRSVLLIQAPRIVIQASQGHSMLIMQLKVIPSSYCKVKISKLKVIPCLLIHLKAVQAKELF